MARETVGAQRRAAMREARSGAGPVAEAYDPGPNPGATAKFGLFGEVLTVGLLITVASLPVVTLPVALAAGVRHLRRFAAAEGSSVALFWGDFRRGLGAGAVGGAVAALLAAILVLDIDLAGTGALPGGAFVSVFGWSALTVLAVAILVAAGQWSPEAGWRRAVRSVPRAVLHDPVGALFLAATVVFVGVVTWALMPLFIPAIGCAALAVLAVPARRRRR
ncbi:hypothetical protein [Microbacterium sp. USHLN186]|uniref:hypothetical protein n=1 Tax=Microbacterium sp. USHLN186 TaxID=3081286 RepID=UPI0030189C65